MFSSVFLIALFAVIPGSVFGQAVNPPSAPGHSGNTTSTITWTWAAGAGNPAGTEYFASDSSGDSGWAADATSWAAGGKSTNTLHTVSVKARDAGLAETVTVSTSAYTSIETPQDLSFIGIHATSITVAAVGSFSNLAAGASGIRLTNVTALTNSGWIKTQSWTSAGLFQNTINRFRARARNGDADETGDSFDFLTFTRLDTPADSALTLTTVSSTSITLTAAQPTNPLSGQTGPIFDNTEGAGGSDSPNQPGVYSFSNSGLTPNTRYGYRLAYKNAQSIPTAFTAVKTTYTFAALPITAAYTAVSSASLTASWGANNNPPGTNYLVELTTDSFSTLAASSLTANSFALFSDLALDTTYATRVKAVNALGAATSAVALGSTRTLADLPGSPGHGAAATDSIPWTWTLGANPPTVEFFASDESGNSGWTAGMTSWTSGGKSPNTPYTLQVKTRNSEGTETASASTTAFTLAADPIGSAISEVSSFSLRANWSENSNPLGTIYVAEASTSAFATVTASSATLNPFAIIPGLAPNTTYAARVRAVNGDSIPSFDASLGSTRTVAAPPASVGHFGDTVLSVSWNWSLAPNPPGTEFFASDGTGNSGWVPGGTIFIKAGKTENTQYALSVKARNADGAESVPASTTAYTAINAPTGLVLGAVGSSSVTLSAEGALPNLTLGASGVKISNETAGNDSGWVKQTSWTATALSSNTLYAFRARARNGDADQTTQTAIFSTYTTLAAPLDAELVLTPDSPVSLTASVAAPPNPATGGSGSEFDNISGLGGTDSGRLAAAYSFADSGLTPNTSYAYRARYYDAAGRESGYSAPKSTYTFAQQPAPLPYVNVATTALEAAWDPGANPLGTVYLVELTTDAFATLVASSRTANASALILGLTANTTYAARVLAFNEYGVPTAMIGLGNQVTRVNPPANPLIDQVGVDLIRVSWGFNGNNSGTRYELQLSTDSAFSPVERSSNTAADFALVAGLAQLTTYYARVHAVSHDGTSSGFVLAGSTFTYADPGPPSAVTDLSAASGAIEGEIDLSWTAPADAATGVPATRYIVKYSPAPIANQAAFDSAPTYAQSWIPLAPGVLETRTLAGLAAGTTFYVAVESEDEFFGRSGLSNAASARAQVDITPPAAVLDLAVTSVSSGSVALSWTAPGDDGAAGTASAYELRYSPLGPLDTAAKLLAAQSRAGPSPSAAGTSESFTLTGLAEDAPYYIALRARDESLNAAPFSNLVSTRTANLAAPAAPLLAPIPLIKAGRSVTIDWLASSENDLAGYRVYRGTQSGGPYAQIHTAQLSQTIFTGTDLAPGDTYYFVVSAFDASALESAYSVEASTFVSESLAPEAPAGISTFLSDDGRYSLRWSPVFYNSDGSALTDLAGYRVYRAASLAGTYTLEAVISPSAAPSWTEAAAGPGAYRTLRAVDLSGNESANAPIAGPNLALEVTSSGGTARLTIPRAVASALLKDSNGLGEDIRLAFARRPAEETGKTLLSFDVVPVRAQSLAAATAQFEFPRASAELLFKVPGLGPAPQGLDSSPLGAASGDVAVFRHDGVDWIKLGGDVDKASGLISVKTSRLGRFQVRESLRASGVAIMQVVPNKIFTPNGDGVNDVIEFYFDNPADSVAAEARIYDLTGAEVSDMRRGSTASSFSWDGRDSGGSVVASGIYVYQFQVSGKTLNGTVVVAR